MAAPVWAAVASSDYDRSTSQTCPKPTGVVEDDTMVAGVVIGDSNTDTITVPTDWNLISDSSGVNNSRLVTYEKVAGDSEPSDYTWSWTANISSGITIGRITGAHLTTPVEGNGTPAAGTTGDANPPSYTPGSSQDYLIIAVAAVSNKGIVWGPPPTNYVEESDEGSGGAGAGAVHIGQSFVSRELTTGSAEDPGDIVPSAQGDWSAQTIFIQPPAVAADVYPPFPRRQLTTVRM